MSVRNISQSVKISSKEEQFLKKKAKENGLDVSKYIRARIFEDDFMDDNKEGPNLQKAEKDMIKLVVNSYNLIYQMAEKNFSQEELEAVLKKSKDWLNKKGYK